MNDNNSNKVTRIDIREDLNIEDLVDVENRVEDKVRGNEADEA